MPHTFPGHQEHVAARLVLARRFRSQGGTAPSSCPNWKPSHGRGRLEHRRPRYFRVGSLILGASRQDSMGYTFIGAALNALRLSISGDAETIVNAFRRKGRSSLSRSHCSSPPRRVHARPSERLPVVRSTSSLRSRELPDGSSQRSRADVSTNPPFPGRVDAPWNERPSTRLERAMA